VFILDTKGSKYFQEEGKREGRKEGEGERERETETERERSR
jgi:hypothetical protein